jgi:hypothetical protein
MDYQIYLPGCRGASPDHLRNVGLEPLLDDGTSLSSIDVVGGPDRGRGTIFYFGDHPRPGYFAKEQSWSPCKPNGTLPAKRFWLGYAHGAKPRPTDLMRRSSLGGEEVLLADGNAWRIPAPAKLPHTYALDSQGRPVRKTKSAYQEWVDRAFSLGDRIMEWRRGGKPDLSIAGTFSFMVATLAMNYRVNADVVDWLGLLDDVSFARIIDAVFELGALEQLEKKKTEPCAQGG